MKLLDTIDYIKENPKNIEFIEFKYARKGFVNVQIGVNEPTMYLFDDDVGSYEFCEYLELLEPLRGKYISRGTTGHSNLITDLYSLKDAIIFDLLTYGEKFWESIDGIGL